jgi:CRISPR system Cascade subunit CasD
VLHLAGPLQSWGERSRFNHRDTAQFPTRSGLIGMIAAAMGRARHETPEDLRPLRFAVRTDRPGTLLRDFHTVGGGQPGKLTVVTAEGTPRPGDAGTLVSHRYYLQDAAFTVAVTAPDDKALLDTCERALRDPCWLPYLGRRSCPPTGPLLLRRSADAWRDLASLPLHRTPHGGDPEVTVTFRADESLLALPVPADCTADQRQTTTQINDEPVSFTTLDRRYLGRTVYQRPVAMPRTYCAGLGATYLNALHRALSGPSIQGADQ